MKNVLKVLDDTKEDGKIYLVKERRGRFSTTKTLVNARKIGDFCYIEEEEFFPIRDEYKKKGIELKTSEVDTKILRAMFPRKKFNAYSFDPPGMGLNIDGLTRISGRLYRMEN